MRFFYVAFISAVLLFDMGAFAQPALKVSPTSIDFGPSDTFPCICSNTTLTITNTGTATAHITAFTITGDTNDFFITTFISTPTNIAPGATASIPLELQPSAPGPRTATLLIQDDAPDSPQQISLQGIGVGPGDWGFGATTGNKVSTVTAGQAAQYDTRLVAGFGFSGTMSFACTGLPPGAACLAGIGPSNTSVTSGPALGAFAQSSPQGAVFVITTTAHASMLPVPLSRLFLLLCLLGALAASLLTTIHAGRAPRIAGATVALTLMLVIVSCGGNAGVPVSTNPPVSTPAGTYLVTFTMTSGSTSRSTQVTLIVQ